MKAESGGPVEEPGKELEPAQQFFAEVLQDRRGSVEWSKVIELLTVNRLCDPQSELGIHQRWFGTTAMDVILGTDDAVAAKDRLYRALDKANNVALQKHAPILPIISNLE